MNLLGPAPAGNPLDETPDTSMSGIFKLLLLGAVGVGVFKLFSPSSEEELDGY